jgi:hypothetical protein
LSSHRPDLRVHPRSWIFDCHPLSLVGRVFEG